MTCLERYFREHPGDYVIGCPHDYGYLNKPDACYSMSCFKDCWPREIQENIQEIDNEQG